MTDDNSARMSNALAVTQAEPPHDIASEDIEDLRQIGEHLVGPELDARLSDILPDAMVVINDSGHIVRFNSKAEFLFGYNRLEVIGQPIQVLLPDDVAERHAGHILRFFEDPRPRPMGAGMVLRGKHKTGREFPVIIDLAPVVLTTGTFACAVVRKA